MDKITIECDTGNVSDGFHTFNELYDHRCYLFIALMQQRPELSWRAKQHEDGTLISGWFIAGMDLPSAPITYHLPFSMWPLLDNHNIKTLDKAFKWDGHTSIDVIHRLRCWCNSYKITPPSA
jgi:hypothetical protein